MIVKSGLHHLSVQNGHNIPTLPFFLAWYAPNWKKEQPSLHTMLLYTQGKRQVPVEY